MEDLDSVAVALDPRGRRPLPARPRWKHALRSAPKPSFPARRSHLPHSSWAPRPRPDRWITPSKPPGCGSRRRELNLSALAPVSPRSGEGRQPPTFGSAQQSEDRDAQIHRSCSRLLRIRRPASECRLRREPAPGHHGAAEPGLRGAPDPTQRDSLPAPASPTRKTTTRTPASCRPRRTRSIPCRSTTSPVSSRPAIS